MRSKTTNKKGFTFGKNWLFFVSKYFGPEVVVEAEKSLKDFAQGYSFKGKTFVDVGCGSGLFSLVAYRLGAKKVLSFDLDSDSVAACRQLWKNQGKPINWEIKKGSALDDRFMIGLGKFDFVYSWGVLHHTGKMWEAIMKVLNLVKKEGLFYLAIYNRTDSWGLYSDGRFGTSHFWVKVKRTYSQWPSILRSLIDLLVIIAWIVLSVLCWKNPLEEIKSHPKKFRGMSWLADIRDWLGGYPYEYASVAEVFNFLKKKGFSLENLKSPGGLMNNEYLFKREK